MFVVRLETTSEWLEMICTSARYGLGMRDGDVRTALRNALVEQHRDEMDDTLLVDELGLCGEVRVDVAVVNGSLSGFELKSARDTLRRLPQQVETYSRVLDYATLVVAENHLAHAREYVLPWWGLTIARGDHEVALECEREPRRNPRIDAVSLAQLLWRDEVLELLEAREAASGVRSKPKRILWQRLVDVTELDELRDAVRVCLKTRGSRWRAAPSRT